MNNTKKLAMVVPMVVMAALLIALVAMPAGAITQMPAQPPESEVLNSPAIPEIISYQGYLTDSDGNPMNGVLTMSFSIYDTETGGTPLWTEAQDVVCSDGLFNVLLGHITPLSSAFFEDSPRYLGVSATGEELTPRQQLASVPYAFQAENAETIDGMDSAEFVAVAGDTMTGTLNLPADGLVAGTDQLVLTDGKVGIGTTSPAYKLDVQGTIRGIHSNGHYGVLGTTYFGVFGAHSSGNTGQIGTYKAGVYGEHISGNNGQLGTADGGVYGEGSTGVYGTGATGVYGSGTTGVYGKHFFTSNYGQLGTNDEGVYGYYNNGNYGKLGTVDEGVYGYNNNGHFGQLGTANAGVYGEHSTSGDYGKLGTEGYGVLGVSTSGWGVYGYSSEELGVYGFSIDRIGVYGQGGSTGVWGEGEVCDFYAGGPGTNYAPFTGAHEVKLAAGFPEDIRPGLIVSVTGENQIRTDEGEISYSSTLPTVRLSDKPGDKTVFGVLISDSPLPEDHWYEASEGERFGIVNALGEGRVWVSNINGDIEAGDYITTSAIAGYGQKQDDDLLHFYTLGKAIETVDWSQVTETVDFDGQTYKIYPIAVVYISG